MTKNFFTNKVSGEKCRKDFTTQTRTVREQPKEGQGAARGRSWADMDGQGGPGAVRGWLEGGRGAFRGGHITSSGG